MPAASVPAGQVPGGTDSQPSAAAPAEAVKRAAEHLKNGPEIAGLKGLGPCALTAMALIASGESPDKAPLSGAMRYLREDASNLTDNQYTGTYAAAVSLTALHMAGEEAFPGGPVGVLTRKLIEYQLKDGGWGDVSRTQFALYGLAAARAMGENPPNEVFQKALSYVLRMQNTDGGWPYRQGESSTGSMTSGALAALHVTLRSLARGEAQCVDKTASLSGARQALEQGRRWLAENLSVEENPGNNRYYYYYLYSLERALKYLDEGRPAGADWYSAAAARLLKFQKKDGSWLGPAGDYPTQFALLFLSRSGWPAAVSKLRWQGDWNRDPYDAETWSEELARRLHFPSEKRTVDLTEPAEYLLQSPVVYVTGAQPLRLSVEAWGKLSSYVEQGGTLVLAPGYGGNDFIRSARTGLEAAFPNNDIERLPPDHAVYIVPYPVRPEPFPLEGINLGCRTGVYVFQAPISCALSGCSKFDETGLDAEEARRLAYNIGYYALGASGLYKKRQREDEVDFDPLADTETPEADKVAFWIGWLKYKGDWAPFTESLGNLLRFASKKLGRVYWYKPVEARGIELLKTPVVYVTGSAAPRLSDSEKETLRAYIEAGGRLVAEPACGDPRFVTGFQNLMRDMFPECKFERLQPAHPIYSCLINVSRAKYKDIVLATVQKNLQVPWLEGVFEGQLLIAVYSPFNMSAEWADKGYTHSRGYMHRDAFNVGLNMLGYFFLER